MGEQIDPGFYARWSRHEWEEKQEKRAAASELQPTERYILRHRITELEQHLSEAQGEIERGEARRALQEVNLRASITLREQEMESYKRLFHQVDEKAQKYDEARALLELAQEMLNPHATKPDIIGDRFQVYLGIRTFLAKHKE